jgi:hypothetical protein
MFTVGEAVYTPLGKGKIVHHFAIIGSYVVEFPWGNGAIFLAEELRRVSSYGHGQAARHRQIQSRNVSA